MANNKIFMFLKREKQAGGLRKLTDKDYPMYFRKIQSIPVVADWIKNNPPSPNLDYKLPFEKMVEVATANAPADSMTPDMIEKIFGTIVKMLGGHPYEKGVAIPKFEGYSVWGILNGYRVTQYNAKVASLNSNK